MKQAILLCCRWTLVLLVLCAGVPNSMAQETTSQKKFTRQGDFDPGSSSWNGLSGLIALASEQGVRVETPQIWDWRQADIKTPLLIIAPQDEKLNVYPLLQFVKRGGRVLIADDFGAGLPLMRAFDLDGYRSGITKKQWRSQKDIDLHRTYPMMGHEADFLLRQASFLFLNVPQWLSRRSGQSQALLRSRPYNSTLEDFDQGGHILYRSYRGWGVALLVSDPSLFINHMIVYGDNRRFVKNMLRYLTTPLKAKKVVLLWGNFVWHGRPQEQNRDLLLFASSFWEGAVEINKELTSLSALYKAYPPYWPGGAMQSNKANQPLTRSFSRIQSEKQFGLYPYITKGAMLCILVMAWLAWLFFYLPVSRQIGKYDPDAEKELRVIANRFEEQLDNYRGGYISYLWPAILLKEELVAFLAEHFELHEHLRGKDPREWDREVLHHLEERVRRREVDKALLDILPRLHRLIFQIPGRHQWNSLSKKNVTHKELNVFYEEAMFCLETLGLKEQFRQPYVRHTHGHDRR